MYDLPEVRAAADALWAGLARHLEREGVADVPRALAHDQPIAALWSGQGCCSASAAATTW